MNLKYELDESRNLTELQVNLYKLAKAQEEIAKQMKLANYIEMSKLTAEQNALLKAGWNQATSSEGI